MTKWSTYDSKNRSTPLARAKSRQRRLGDKEPETREKFENHKDRLHLHSMQHAANPRHANTKSEGTCACGDMTNTAGIKNGSKKSSSRPGYTIKGDAREKPVQRRQ